jgi:2-iminobutanoate/2-iminopropanoate deaminase
MPKQIIFTEKAPAPIGPYSQAVLINNSLYCSGQIALDPKTGAMVQDNISLETERVMHNLDAILHAAKMTFENVVKTTIYITNMDNFSAVNQVYSTYFTTAPPARETVQVSKLPKNANVEISVVAVIG